MRKTFLAIGGSACSSIDRFRPVDGSSPRGSWDEHVATPPAHIPNEQAQLSCDEVLLSADLLVGKAATPPLDRLFQPFSQLDLR